MGPLPTRLIHIDHFTLLTCDQLLSGLCMDSIIFQLAMRTEAEVVNDLLGSAHPALNYNKNELLRSSEQNIKKYLYK